jgi:stage III sporulation protein AF
MMTEIGGWAVQILVISLTYALMEQFLPQSGLKQLARAAIGLMVMLAILQPVTSMVTGEKDLQMLLGHEVQDLKGTDHDSNETLQKSYEEWIWKVYMDGEKNTYENRKGNE